MPSEEGKQVLRLLAEGKIDADQAFRILRALGDIPGAPPPRPPLPPSPPDAPAEPPPGLKGRIVRIQVISGGTTKVKLPIALAIWRASKDIIDERSRHKNKLAHVRQEHHDV